MSAFNDAACEKCGRRISWVGEVKDQPACIKCGHKPDPAKLAADQKQLQDFEDYLIERKKRRESS
jgi:hypothetical protein